MASTHTAYHVVSKDTRGERCQVLVRVTTGAYEDRDYREQDATVIRREYVPRVVTRTRLLVFAGATTRAQVAEYMDDLLHRGRGILAAVPEQARARAPRKRPTREEPR